MATLKKGMLSLKENTKRILKRNGSLLGAGALIAAIRLYRTKAKRRKKSKAVLILGNGRSGTSVLTRCLNFMGVDLGKDKFLDPTEVNPKGYFENETILNIHRKIGGKLRFRPSPPGYENFKEIQPYKKQLIKYINEKFSDKPVWAWKDPRTNDYMDLWKDVLKQVNAEPHCVVIIRNPIDVVRSNKKAWDRDETWALRQWQLRTLFSLRESYGEKRVIVSYEELFENSLKCLRRISRTLKLPWPKDEKKLKSQIHAFIDPNLQRSNSGTSIDEFLESDKIGRDSKELYLLALEGTRSQKYFQSKEFHERVEKLYKAYLNDYGTLKRNPPKKKNNP